MRSLDDRAGWLRAKDTLLLVQRLDDYLMYSSVLCVDDGVESSRLISLYQPHPKHLQCNIPVSTVWD
jgi:hypothetical protein